MSPATGSSLSLIGNQQVTDAPILGPTMRWTRTLGTRAGGLEAIAFGLA